MGAGKEIRQRAGKQDAGSFNVDVSFSVSSVAACKGRKQSSVKNLCSEPLVLSPLNKTGVWKVSAPLSTSLTAIPCCNRRAGQPVLSAEMGARGLFFSPHCLYVMRPLMSSVDSGPFPSLSPY